MATNTVIWIVVAAVVAAVLIAVVVFVARNATRRRRSLQARDIREQVHADTTKVEKREAFADETASKARAAQAEAEAKSAEAARLQQRADTHRDHAANTRDELRQQSEHADSIDPKTRPQDQTARADEDGAAQPEAEIPPRTTT